MAQEEQRLPAGGALGRRPEDASRVGAGNGAAEFRSYAATPASLARNTRGSTKAAVRRGLQHRQCFSSISGRSAPADQSSRRRGRDRCIAGACESWCSSKSVWRCSSAPFRGKAPAAAERPVHAHLRADDREQPARTRIACRGRSVGATGQRPLRRAVAISKQASAGPTRDAWFATRGMTGSTTAGIIPMATSRSCRAPALRYYSAVNEPAGAAVPTPSENARTLRYLGLQGVVLTPRETEAHGVLGDRGD
jgi:hypothetical protein